MSNNSDDSSSLLGQLNERFHLKDNVRAVPQRLRCRVGIRRCLGGRDGAQHVLVVHRRPGADRLFPGRHAAGTSNCCTGSSPHQRRPRAVLLGDQILVKVGGYVLGNVIISIISAVVTFVWLLILRRAVRAPAGHSVRPVRPDPGDRVTVAGVLVALAAFSVSVPVGIATVGYFIAYKFLEDYVLSPQVFGKVLKLPALVTVVAILIGAALLGLVGALVALPDRRGADAADPGNALPATGSQSAIGLIPGSTPALRPSLVRQRSLRVTGPPARMCIREFRTTAHGHAAAVPAAGQRSSVNAPWERFHHSAELAFPPCAG